MLKSLFVAAVLFAGVAIADPLSQSLVDELVALQGDPAVQAALANDPELANDLDARQKRMMSLLRDEVRLRNRAQEIRDSQTAAQVMAMGSNPLTQGFRGSSESPSAYEAAADAKNEAAQDILVDLVRQYRTLKPLPKAKPKRR